MSKITLHTFIAELCYELGLNTAHDYDGIESPEDAAIYSKAIIKEIQSLKKIANNSQEGN